MSRSGSEEPTSNTRSSRRDVRRWWGCLVTIVVVFLSILLAPAWRGTVISDDGAVHVGPGNKTVFIGFSGVVWEDISPEKTPVLAELYQRGASANMVVKTLGVTTCPNAGWLTISQGVRAGDPIADGCAGQVTASHDGVLPQEVEAARLEGEKSSPYDVPDTTLGDELARADISVATIGSGAALATRSSSNMPLAQRQHRNAKTENGLTVDAAQLYRQVSDADLVVVDMGQIINRRAGDGRVEPAVGQKSKGMLADLRAAFASADTRSVQATADIAVLDEQIGKLVEHIDPGATIILASVADSDSQTAHLQFFTAIGADIEPSSLAYTNSTRHRGLIQLTDLPQFIMTQLGERPIPDFVGSAIATNTSGPVPASDIATQLRDDDARAIAVRPAVGPFYVLFSAMAVIFLGWWGWLRWRAIRSGEHLDMSQAHTLFGLSVAMMPVSSFLANLLPWWNWPYSTVVFLLIVMAVSACGAYLSAGTSKPSAVVALVSASVLSIDVLAGSMLHSSSVLGDQPQQGGRFYGLSNAPFTIFAISMLWLTIIAVQFMRLRYRNVTVPGTVIVMGLSAIILDGAGSLGADFGGVPALFTAFFVLFIALGGRTLTPRTLLTVLGVGTGIGIAVAFVDWLRPEESWTHVARFFQSLIDGEAVTIVYRKLMFMLGSAPWFVWLIVALVAAGYWNYRARIAELVTTADRYSDDNGLGPDIAWVDRSVLVLIFVAIALNDSGLVILLIGVGFGAPLSLVARNAPRTRFRLRRR